MVPSLKLLSTLSETETEMQVPGLRAQASKHSQASPSQTGAQEIDAQVPAIRSTVGASAGASNRLFWEGHEVFSVDLR